MPTNTIEYKGDGIYYNGQLVGAANQSATAPSSPSAGDFYYNTGDNTMYYWNGADWVAMGGGSSSGGGALQGSVFSWTVLSPRCNYTDNQNVTLAVSATSPTIYITSADDNPNLESRSVASDSGSVSASSQVTGLVKIGIYLYVSVSVLSETRVYRYTSNNLAGGGTQMTATFLNSLSDVRMSSDGTYLYFAGGDQDNSVIKASFSGTTITQQSTITCGSTSGLFDNFVVDSNYFYVADGDSDILYKFDMTGTLQNTVDGYQAGINFFVNVGGEAYGIFYRDYTYHLMKAPV